MSYLSGEMPQNTYKVLQKQHYIRSYGKSKNLFVKNDWNEYNLIPMEPNKVPWTQDKLTLAAKEWIGKLQLQPT